MKRLVCVAGILIGGFLPLSAEIYPQGGNDVLCMVAIVNAHTACAQGTAQQCRDAERKASQICD